MKNEGVIEAVIGFFVVFVLGLLIYFGVHKPTVTPPVVVQQAPPPPPAPSTSQDVLNTVVDLAGMFA